VIRAVIDTNVLVSGLLSPAGNEALILLAIHQGLVRHEALSCLECWASSDVNGAISPRRSEEIFCDARNRLHEVRIVWTALDDCLFFDKSLVLPVQVEPRLDCYRPAHAELSFINERVREAAHFATGIRVQLEAPHDSIGRGAVRFRWFETPVSELGPGHLAREIARQVGAVKSRQTVSRFDFQR
jgi:hypothetical protein